jgi:hypothetical protein
MAPVAGGITDGQKYGFVFLSCPHESIIPPWIPVYRVMGMLEEIGGFFID